jgi:hypothetical protein
VTVFLILCAIGLAYWVWGLDGLSLGIRRIVVGSESKLVERAIEQEARGQPLSNEQVFLVSLDNDREKAAFEVLVGHLADGGGDIAIPLERLVGLHRWSTGATGAGKSAQTLAEEIQLVGPGMPWSLLHLDAKGESAPWMTDYFLPAMLMQHERREVEEFLEELRVVNPFDEQNLPALNVLIPQPGVSIALQAREVANLVGKLLGPSGGGTWGPRMTNVLFYALRLALEAGNLSLLEVRTLLINDQYLNGILKNISDQDVREYFVYRFPSENKESIAAVVSRLELLLLDDTARVLCAPKCLSPSALIEQPLSIINVGNAPMGAEFLSTFWMGVFVRGIGRAIIARPRTERPVFCVVDEWWLGLDDELAFHFERLLTQARFKNVGLWLLNQLPAQIGERLLRVIENSCGFQTAFRQSHRDAGSMAYMLPVSDDVRIRRTPDHPKWDTRVATATEQRQHLVEELSRLENRHFWFYPKIYGSQAVKLRSPDVHFDWARREADRAPNWLRDACRGRGSGFSRVDLDEHLELRRARMVEIARGPAREPKRKKDAGEGGRPSRQGPPPPPPRATEAAPAGQGSGPETTASNVGGQSAPPPHPPKLKRRGKGEGSEPYLG